MSVDTYHRSLGEVVGLDASMFDVPGTSVVTTPNREAKVSHYLVAQRALIWTSPALADRFARWHNLESTTSADSFTAWAIGQGAIFLGQGYDHVLDTSFEPPPPSAFVHQLDGGSAETMAIAAALFARCSPADLDEAEFQIDASDLDPHLTGWMSPDSGEMLAIAGGRTWDLRPGFADIGVLVDPATRRAGSGRSVVAAVIPLILEAGLAPLYRCSIENVGSKRLADSLGFIETATVSAVTWPTQ